MLYHPHLSSNNISSDAYITWAEMETIQSYLISASTRMYFTRCATERLRQIVLGVGDKSRA